MGQIFLRPELVTSGGEACGIMLNDQYVGSLTLLYREEDRLYGSVQLDEESIDLEVKEEIDHFVQRYVEDKVDALAIPECFVTVTYSEYDHIVVEDELEDEETYIVDEDEELYVDVYEDKNIPIDFVVIRDDIDTLTLDIYSEQERLNSRIGTATLNLDEEELTGLVHFVTPPDKEVREQIAYQLIDEVEEITDLEMMTITMQYRDQVIDEFVFDKHDQHRFS